MEKTGAAVTVGTLKPVADRLREVSCSRRDLQADIDRWRDEQSVTDRTQDIPDEVTARFVRAGKTVWAELKRRFEQEAAVIAAGAEEKIADAWAARDRCLERIEALEESLATARREHDADRKSIAELSMKTEVLASEKAAAERDNALLRDKVQTLQQTLDRLSEVLSLRLESSDAGAGEKDEVK